MRYVAAYMLAAMSGKHHITTADIENILGSVGVDCDHDKASNVVDCMHGKTVDELIAQGSQYLCAFGGAGGSVAAPAAASAPAGGAPAAGAPAAEKKEEKKKEEKEEESDEDLGFGELTPVKRSVVGMKSGGECPGVACSSDVIPRTTPISLTPPTSPKSDGTVSFTMLPEKFLLRVCSSPALDVTDRLNLMLTCKRLRAAVSKSWNSITKLRIANNESDDDRIDDRFVITCIDRSASSLTSITLCLNSSINSQFCKGIQLFQHLRACSNLRELTLLLTQLPLRYLNSGLAHISGLSLRKLALVNSVADATTMRIVANTQGSTLRSLGLINCFHLSDDAFEPIVSNMHLLTLNIRSSRRISAVSIQRVIDAYEHRRQPRQLKLYNYRSSVYRQSLRYDPERVLFCDEKKCLRKRLRSGKFLNENAIRPDWEYDSDEDDFV